MSTSTKPTKTISAPLVGSYFRPPAKIVLDVLPAGCELILEPDPHNAYDPKAIKVSVPTKAIPENQYVWLESELPAAGWGLDDLLRFGTNNGQTESQDELLEPTVWLGFIVDSDGKAMAKMKAAGAAPDLVGNREVAEAMLDRTHSAKLGFDPAGKPLVIVTRDDTPDKDFDFDSARHGDDPGASS